MMRSIFPGLISAFLAVLLASPVPGQTKTKPKKSTSTKAAKSTPAVANTLPAGAEKIGEFKWRYKDSAGKTWIYVQTPFGFSKLSESDYMQQNSQPADESAVAATKVVAQSSDGVTFERQTPFGPQRWTKKRAELNPTEKAALEKSGEAAGASAKAQE